MDHIIVGYVGGNNHDYDYKSGKVPNTENKSAIFGSSNFKILRENPQ
jgi:hypothetical protein